MSLPKLRYITILVQISYDGDGRGPKHRISPAWSPSRTPVWVGSFNQFRNAPSFLVGRISIVSYRRKAVLQHAEPAMPQRRRHHAPRRCMLPR